MTSEFGNTFCITMSLADGTGTHYRIENGEPYSDDLFVIYTVDQEAGTMELTVDGVKRTGTFTENELVVSIHLQDVFSRIGECVDRSRCCMG